MNRSLHQGESLLSIHRVRPRRAGDYRRRAGIVQVIRRLGTTAGADLRVAVRAQRVVLLRLRFERFRFASRSTTYFRVLVHVALQSIRCMELFAGEMREITQLSQTASLKYSFIKYDK